MALRKALRSLKAEAFFLVVMRAFSNFPKSEMALLTGSAAAGILFGDAVIEMGSFFVVGAAGTGSTATTPAGTTPGESG